MVFNTHIKLKERIKYFPHLDGTRFIAFFMVFLVHCFISVDPEIGKSEIYLSIKDFCKVGFLGVDYFFVLSGFLISWVILHEKSSSGNFKIGQFLMRRTLRIWPLYFFIVLFGYITFYASSYLGTEVAGLPPFYIFGLFVVNFYSIYEGIDYLFFLTFLWSISIEEQFYVGYSVIAKSFFKLNLMLIAIVLIVISLVFRYFNIENGASLYFHTLSVLGNFGVGILVAHFAQKKKGLFIWLISGGKVFSSVVYFVLAASLIYYNELNEIVVFRIVSKLYFSILFGYIILEQCFAKDRFLSFGKRNFIKYLGKISFGLYCYHGVVITLLLKALERMEIKETYWHVFLIYPVIILLLSIGVSAISYRYFEGFFLRLKSKFSV